MSSFWDRYPPQWKEHNNKTFEKAHEREFRCPECKAEPTERMVLNIASNYGGQTWTFKLRCPESHEWVEKVYMWTD